MEMHHLRSLTVALLLPFIQPALAGDDAPAGPSVDGFNMADQGQCETRTLPGQTTWRNGRCECSDPSDQDGFLVVDEGDDGNVAYPHCPGGPSGGSGDDGTSTTPGQPSPGGGGGNPNKQPTPYECDVNYSKCLDNLHDTVEQCYVESLDMLRRQVIVEHIPCFGVPPEQIWNSREVGPISCNDISLFEDSLIGRMCTHEFKRRAMLLCFNGSSDESHQYSSEDGIDLSFETKSGFKAGYSGKDSFSITVNSPGKEGAKAACWRKVSSQGMKQCKAIKQECMALAGQQTTTSMQALMVTMPNPAPNSTVAQQDPLLSRIDRVLLGLAPKPSSSPSSSLSGKKPKAHAVAMGNFREVAKHSGGRDQWHRARLEFLADWSEFLKRNRISASKQSTLEQALSRAQSQFLKELNHFTTIYIERHAITEDLELETDANWIALYQRYHNDKVAQQQFHLINKQLMDAFDQSLSYPQYADFSIRAWPGIGVFGIAAPMTTNAKHAPKATTPSKATNSTITTSQR